MRWLAIAFTSAGLPAPALAQNSHLPPGSTLAEAGLVSDDIGALWTEAMRAGDFTRAWQLSDRVLASRRGRTFWHLPRHLQPVWDGRDPAGSRVLVRCYHGLGDTIQFARFLPRLKERAREVIVWAQPELTDLLRPLGVDRILPLHDGAPEVEYDVDLEIMELGHVLRVTSESVGVDVPYLGAAAAPLPGGFRVGIAWRAGGWNPARSVELRDLKPLLDRPGAAFYALQKDVHEDECDADVVLDDRRLTIEGTAALIASMDLVVTVDSMPAHLAGALGVPTWTLLPREADWRWMDARDDTPWYPSMRLFRQERAGAWHDVVARVACELDVVRLARGGTSTPWRADPEPTADTPERPD